MTRTFMVCISCNKNWRTVDQYCKKRIIEKKKKTAKSENKMEVGNFSQPRERVSLLWLVIFG